MKAPLWASTLVRLSRGLHTLHRAQEIARDELLFAFLPARHRDELTALSYGAVKTYLPGSEIYETGLFAWEQKLLEHRAVPKSGTVLLGGAGGGRELVELARRGYRVVAFEPARRACEAARRVAAEFSNCQVLQASFSDLTRSELPLELAALSGPFDVVVLGWGSFTHVTEPEAQLELLGAVRRLAPSAPVIMSFFVRMSSAEAAHGGAARLRAQLRRAFRALGGNERRFGVEFHVLHGFTYAYTPEEIALLIERSGYEQVELELEPYPHALLLPR